MKQPNKYWATRQRDLLFNSAIGTAEKQLADEYIRVFEYTRDEMTALYDQIVADNVNGRGYVLASDLYRYDRYYEILNHLQVNLISLGQAEIKIGEAKLTEMYVANRKLVSDELDLQSAVSPRHIQSAINATWCQDGKNWSSRVWSNKAALNEVVKKGIVDCVARGASKDELVKELQKTFNTGFHNADRIARTELNYVQNQAAFDEYKASGVQRYQILATHDDRTCDEPCAGEDGKIYFLNQASVGVNYPPFHPNCRCGVLAVIEGGFLQ